MLSQIARFIGPTWGPPGSCRPQMGPMLAPWTLLSGMIAVAVVPCVATQSAAMTVFMLDTHVPVRMSSLAIPVLRKDRKWKYVYVSSNKFGATMVQLWCHKAGSTSAQVMACCLTAPSHCLNQCWQIISEVLWNSPQGNFAGKCYVYLSVVWIWKFLIYYYIRTTKGLMS